MSELENIIIALMFMAATQRARLNSEELTMPALAIAARRIAAL